MATLQAHGTKLVEVEREIVLSSDTRVTVRRALMSDLVELERCIYVRPDGSRNNDGWKRHGRVNMTRDDWTAKRIAEGFKRV